MGNSMSNYDDNFLTDVGAIAAFVGLTRLCWSAALDSISFKIMYGSMVIL